MHNSSYNKISALAAFILWSTWTYHVNSSADNVLTSALFQGLISSILTLVMIKLVKKFAKLFKTTWMKIVYPSFIISTLCFTTGFVVHSTINTSQVIKTILPAVVVGFIFCIITGIKNIISEERANV